MSSLYLTADRIGGPSGGSKVTFHESEALRSLGECEVWGRDELEKSGGDTDYGCDPWLWDNIAVESIDFRNPPQLAHFYAGTFSTVIRMLKQKGCRITYTAAAHSIAVSKREHEKLGLPYYQHLTDPELFKRYIAGYLAADVLIVPSQHSAQVMRSYGATNRIEIIPHGVDIPTAPIVPLPKTFRVGYLGNCIAPDKGLIYLLTAWKKLGYKDATLVIGGHDSASNAFSHLVRRFSGGNIQLVGWVDDVADFYNGISLYVQPSASEGFSLEVLEAMSYGRPVLCSDGAGAADVVSNFYRVRACNVDDIANWIDAWRKGKPSVHLWEEQAAGWRNQAAKYSWDKIRQRYIDVWRDFPFGMKSERYQDVVQGPQVWSSGG